MHSTNGSNSNWKRMAFAFSFLILLFAGDHLLAQSIKDKDRMAIVEIMARQEQAWNKGDLEGFMDGYWRSDSLRFIGSKATYGWQQTLDNYHKGYPDRERMGQLHFTLLHVEGLGKNWAHVTGKWELQRATDNPGGYFTLLWRKIDGKWVIVADHSS